MEGAIRKEILRGKALTDALIVGWFYIATTLLLHSYYFYNGWANLPGSDLFVWKNLAIYVGIFFWLIASITAIFRVVTNFTKESFLEPNLFISIWGPCLIGLLTTLLNILVLVLYEGAFL